MKPIRKLLIALGAVAALAVPSVSAVPAFAAGDNAAAAINTTDGKTVYRIAIKVTRDSSQVVTDTNIAFAYASCTGCETVAIAFQGVLITGDPNVVTPQNFAIAENVNCDGCLTYADATQVDIMTGGPVHFTPLGNQTLASIRHDLHSLKQDDLTFDQLVARVQADANLFTWVFITQLVSAGNS